MIRPGGRPKRRAREAAGERVTSPLPPTNPDLPVHRAAAERAERYVWEPFQRGNFLGVRSGHTTDRIVSRLAAELHEWVVAEFPDLAQPRYRFSVASWARAEAIVALITHYLDRVDIVDGEGEVRQKVLEQLRASERRAAEERRSLGMTPQDHPRLERERVEAAKGVVDLDALRARGRKALQARRERVGEHEHLDVDGEHLADEEESS